MSWLRTGLEPATQRYNLAWVFTSSNIDRVRFVDKWGRWYIWDGKRWAPDDTRHVFDLVCLVCREQSRRCNNLKTKRQLAGAKTVAAVHRLAQADQRTAATVTQWDANPWLLNTPDGVIDSSSGERRLARPKDYLTKMTSVSPRGECPLFLKFLAEVMAGEIELQRFLQRVFGYALTGMIQEQALFFAYGTGANGKGTLTTGSEQEEPGRGFSLGQRATAAGLRLIQQQLFKWFNWRQWLGNYRSLVMPKAASLANGCSQGDG